MAVAGEALCAGKLARRVDFGMTNKGRTMHLRDPIRSRRWSEMLCGVASQPARAPGAMAGLRATTIIMTIITTRSRGGCG
jgi:hypothetical protein